MCACVREHMCLHTWWEEAVAGEGASEGGVAASGRTVRASRNLVFYSGIGHR